MNSSWLGYQPEAKEANLAQFRISYPEIQRWMKVDAAVRMLTTKAKDRLLSTSQAVAAEKLTSLKLLMRNCLIAKARQIYVFYDFSHKPGNKRCSNGLMLARPALEY